MDSISERYILVFFTCLCLYFQPGFGQDVRVSQFKYLVSVNTGNLLILRPQLCLEFRLNQNYSIEVTGGYIAKNQWMQDRTVKFLGEDAYLGSGYHTGLALKKIVTEDAYVTLQTYYKSHGYQNALWKNGYSEGQEGAMAYIISNKKKQAGLLVTGGFYKPVFRKLFLNLFGGFGLLYYTFEKEFHEKIYDYSLRYIDKTVPFSESQSSLYPIIHMGIKLGAGFGK